MFSGLVSNSWPQVIHLPWPPKVFILQAWVTLPSLTQWYLGYLSFISSLTMNFFILFVFETGSHPVTWLECSGLIIAHCNLELLGSRDPPTSVSWVLGTTGIHHHIWHFLIFIFCRDGSCYIAQGWSWTSGLKPSSHLNLPKCWNYKRELLCIPNL